jgi:hypothetical protein
MFLKKDASVFLKEGTESIRVMVAGSDTLQERQAVQA